MLHATNVLSSLIVIMSLFYNINILYCETIHIKTNLK